LNISISPTFSVKIVPTVKPRRLSSHGHGVVHGFHRIGGAAPTSAVQEFQGHQLGTWPASRDRKMVPLFLKKV
jgi:hypothetical protein